jgi:hypothetical protein
MFAITMTFVFMALIALVADADTLMVRYNQVDAEALLAAQTGATDVDTNALYAPRPSYQLVTTGVNTAKDVCESVHLKGGTPHTHHVSCRMPSANTVTATVSWDVSLPIPLFMTTATVSATRTGQAVFGGQQAVTVP